MLKLSNVMYDGTFNCEFIAEHISKRIFKIGQYLMQL